MKCEANCFKKEKVFFGPHMFMFDVKRFLRYCGFLKNFGVFILVYFFFIYCSDHFGFGCYFRKTYGGLKCQILTFWGLISKLTIVF